MKIHGREAEDRQEDRTVHQSPSVTVDEVLEWIGDDPDALDWVVAVFGGCERLTGNQILSQKDFLDYRWWLVLHEPLLSERDQRLLTADVAEHVLHYYEQSYPGDARPRKAIQAARDYAHGMIDAKERVAVYKDVKEAELFAGTDALWFGKSGAAWHAARAAVQSLFRSTAMAAAIDAAKAAAYAVAKSDADTAWEIARSAEREWQVARALYYLRGEKQPRIGSRIVR